MLQSTDVPELSHYGVSGRVRAVTRCSDSRGARNQFVPLPEIDAGAPGLTGSGCRGSRSGCRTVVVILGVGVGVP